MRAIAVREQGAKQMRHRHSQIENNEKNTINHQLKIQQNATIGMYVNVLLLFFLSFVYGGIDVSNKERTQNKCEFQRQKKN